MPDKLKQLLLQRPPDATNPYQGRGVKVIPWEQEDAATRFMGGVTGDDLPGGGVAGLIGALIGMGNPVRGLTGAKAAANLAKSERVALPQVADAFQKSGKYTPEISSEMGRLIGEMIPDKKFKASWQEFHKMNPEATGHVRQLRIGPNRNVDSKLKDWATGDLGAHYSSSNAVPRWSELEVPGEREWAGEIDVRPTSSNYWFGKDKRATLAHELQHQAQQMIEGGDQFSRNYATMMRNPQIGYSKNPYEIEANKVAGDVMQRLMGKK